MELYCNFGLIFFMQRLMKVMFSVKWKILYKYLNQNNQKIPIYLSHLTPFKNPKIGPMLSIFPQRSSLRLRFRRLDNPSLGHSDRNASFHTHFAQELGSLSPVLTR
jgi:hypothetical protein